LQERHRSGTNGCHVILPCMRANRVECSGHCASRRQQSQLPF
jgi:hypothetical protein